MRDGDSGASGGYTTAHRTPTWCAGGDSEQPRSTSAMIANGRCHSTAADGEGLSRAPFVCWLYREPFSGTPPHESTTLTRMSCCTRIFYNRCLDNVYAVKFTPYTYGWYAKTRAAV